MRSTITSNILFAFINHSVIPNFVLFVFIFSVISCSSGSAKSEEPLGELEIENLNDHVALGEIFTATIKIPPGSVFDTIIFDHGLPGAEVSENNGLVTINSTVTSVKLKQIKGKVLTKTKSGESQSYRFYTAYKGFIPAIAASGTYLIRNKTNEIHITGIYGERLEKTIVEMKNATYEREGNTFFITPGNDSIVEILVKGNRSNPSGQILLGTIRYKVINN